MLPKPPYLPPSHRALRAQDIVIRQVLWDHPNAPRPVVDFWYPTRNLVYAMIAISAMFGLVSLFWVIPFVLDCIHTGTLWHNPLAIQLVFFTPYGLYLLIHLAIHPLYDWNIGIHRGRPAAAVVTFIAMRPTPNSVRGTWEISTHERRFARKFRHFALESGTWVDSLREGDRINVLLHPTKNKVLLAYGP